MIPYTGKMEQILLAYGFLKQYSYNSFCYSYNDAQQGHKGHDLQHHFFSLTSTITAKVLQGDKLVPLQFIICLDYIL